MTVVISRAVIVISTSSSLSSGATLQTLWPFASRDVKKLDIAIRKMTEEFIGQPHDRITDLSLRVSKPVHSERKLVDFLGSTSSHSSN